MLNDPAAGWLVALDDGMGDLRTEIDYDLAGRLRSATRQAEERIATSDPADAWDDFAGLARATGDVRRRRDLPRALDRAPRRWRRRSPSGSKPRRPTSVRPCRPTTSRAIESVHVGEAGGSSAHRRSPAGRPSARRVVDGHRGVQHGRRPHRAQHHQPAVARPRHLHGSTSAARGEATTAGEPARAGPSIGRAATSKR